MGVFFSSITSNMKTSAILICKNEAHHIRRCLESIQWVDEIIIIDSASTDNTVEICREFTDQVFITHDWPGFGIQKNRALEKANGDWVLSIDADESLTDELKNEIQLTINSNDTMDGYFIYRQNYFCGKAIHYGEWRNDKVLRLFKREKGLITKDIVHESIQVNGKTADLKNKLQHDTFQSLDACLVKINRYSTLAAEKKYQQEKRGGLTLGALKGSWAFFKSYFIQLGFLDGREGLLIAVMCFLARFYTMNKLYYLQKRL